MMTSDSTQPQELTDRMLVLFILKISGLVFLAGSFFRDLRFLITAIAFGRVDVLFYSYLSLAFTIVISTILLVFGDKIASILARQSVLIDTSSKALVAVTKSIGIILIATRISPLCLSILGFLQLNSHYHNSDLMKYVPDQSVGHIVESGLAILLGIYLATGVKWFINMIERRKSEIEPLNDKP